MAINLEKTAEEELLMLCALRNEAREAGKIGDAIRATGMIVSLLELKGRAAEVEAASGETPEVLRAREHLEPLLGVAPGTVGVDELARMAAAKVINGGGGK